MGPVFPAPHLRFGGIIIANEELITLVQDVLFPPQNPADELLKMIKEMWPKETSLDSLNTDMVSFPQATEKPMHLDNSAEADCMQESKEDFDMAYKIRRSIIIEGKTKWITANSEQEYAEKLGKLFESSTPRETHNFGQYALGWYELYSKPNIAKVTQETYKRQLDLYLIPAFGNMALEDITTDDVQRLFNGMTGAKATKDKTRMVLNMILDTAVDDNYIAKNPVKSKKVKITGKPAEFTKCYTVEQMKYIISNLDRVQNPTDRAYLAMQALHPMRLEEVLGLKWEDIDTEAMTIHIQRAVTHPKRNQPEIKPPKTEASNRRIGLSSLAKEYLVPGEPSDYVFGGAKPLSYTQVRRMCARIEKDISFGEKITPIRFRTTVLTDIYDSTKDVKLAQAAAGHTTAAMTLKHYIKGRESVAQTANVIDAAYS